MTEYNYIAHYSVSGATIHDGAWMEDPETHYRTRPLNAPDDFRATDIARSFIPDVRKEFMGFPNVRLHKLERIIQEEKKVPIPLKP